MPFFGSNIHTKASFVLEWIADERFALREQFRYRYEKTGDIFIVPRELGRFSTDFASVPSFATWLVPRVGNHAPAAVLHDALVAPQGAPTDHIGREVTRDEADEIFHTAMVELGVPFIRRWLLHLGVRAGTAMTLARRRVFVMVTSVVLLVLLTLTLLDLFDRAEFLPWMGDRPFLVELPLGLAALLAWVGLAALAAPGHRRVVLGAGLFLVFLALPLVAIQLTTSVYYLAERFFGLLAPPPADDRPAEVARDDPVAASMIGPLSTTGSVFVSYASEDLDRVEPLVDTIEKETAAQVWWDFDLEPGDDWNAEILAKLNAADCVVVVWSEAAVASDWVRFEANEALRRNAYVPAAIEPVTLEGDLDRQRAKLYDDRNNVRLRQLLDKIRETLARRDTATVD